MFIRIEPAIEPAIEPGNGAPTVSAHETDDCTRLHVIADGLDDAAAGAHLRNAGLGWPAGTGHVWLDVAALRDLARAQGNGPGWEDRFDAMVAYARSHGWVDNTGDRLRAHIARP